MLGWIEAVMKRKRYTILFTRTGRHGRHVQQFTGTLAFLVRKCTFLDDLDVARALALVVGDQFGDLNFTLQRLPDNED